MFDVKLRLPAEIHWTPDGQNITYVSGENGIFDIWGQSLYGGEPKKLSNFNAEEVFSFAWTQDNKLVISQGNRYSDVFLIKNIKSDN